MVLFTLTTILKDSKGTIATLFTTMIHALLDILPLKIREILLH